MLIGLAFYVFMRREPPYEIISIINLLPDCLLRVRSYLLNVESKAFHKIVDSAPDFFWSLSLALYLYKSTWNEIICYRILWKIIGLIMVITIEIIPPTYGYGTYDMVDILVMTVSYLAPYILFPLVMVKKEVRL
jgi:hypothetical protein